MIERLEGVLDELLDVSLAGVGDEDLCVGLVEVHRAQARLCAVKARLLAGVDRRGAFGVDGSKSVGAWLARRCHASPGVTAGQAKMARRLGLMPVTAGALGVGEIDEQHAQVLARVAGSPREAVAEAFPEAEEMLVGFARELFFDDFVKAVKRWVDLVDEDGAEDQADRDHAARRVHLSETFEGTFVVDGQLDAIGGSEVATALGRIEGELFERDVREAKEHTGADPTPDDLGRTMPQRRADALVEMARRAMAMPADAVLPQPLVTVVVGLETLTGRVCELFNRTPVTPGQVARLLDEAEVERAVFASKSRIIELGERRRFFEDGLRRVLEIRDRHCTHPGCDVAYDRCEGDHILPWTNDRFTVQDNGRLSCGRHNRWAYNHEQHGRDPDPPLQEDSAMTRR